ncbi:urease accessory protein UreF [Vibrio methylphosphonaticus]|uniref:urease accessory protein UreF n=1 Tax=Vibrio methylphosphonaticus TaxID=2946866 RepID=UPI00202ABE28|nr:urease accessory UreF family protein [Vibrio methylphosphonaticus]MCL9776841.1 urease accessory protein UreF [Vibrio methylphosphonaticus]
MPISAEIDNDVSTYRLFQLISPSLPIGGFTYSQGLEWAVEATWVTNRTSMEEWLGNMLFSSVATLELPIIDRLYDAVRAKDTAQIQKLSQMLHSSRETKELRAEEKQRGLALNTLLKRLEIQVDGVELSDYPANQLLGLCVAAVHWNIDLMALKKGYLWSWAENLVMAGVKLVPLGQTDGQIALINLSDQFTKALRIAEQTEDWMIGSFTPSVSIASSLHETQYTRLFRS